MTTFTIDLPGDLLARLTARAAAAGHADVEQYIEAVLRAEACASEDYGAPPDASFDVPAELEAKLLEGLNSPAREMTASDWDDMRRKLINRHAAKRER